MTKKALFGCEMSGIVRDEFARLGWDAWSCDLVPCERGGKHLQCDVREVLNDGWDLAVFFTPCTYLCNSGAKHLYIDGRRANGRNLERWDLLRRDAELFKTCMNAPIPRIANENPIPLGYALEIIGRKYDQIIQPWQFGHGETKATCLWLKNLPPLTQTNVVNGREQRIWKMPPSPTRQTERSRTFTGIARAMAEQWSQP